MPRRGDADAKLAGVTPTPIAVLAAILLTTCGSSGGETTASSTAPRSASPTTEPPTTAVEWVGPCGRPPGAAEPVYEHIIWIWMENKNRSSVFDSTETPFMHSLAESCGTASNYVDHGLRPSLPNYISATSGDPQGVGDDEFPATHPLQVDNIFRQVRGVGKVSKSYQEAMPANCTLESTSQYAVKHNPAAYYVGGDDRKACETDNVPFDQFMTDLAGNLPAFSLITPDICNDMHDCPVATGDKWLAELVPTITASAIYRDGRTAVFIVFDESLGSGTTPFIAIAPAIVPGTVADVELDHYALLAFAEDTLGITTRLGKAATAASMADAFGL
jgi:phosphatidylinositol-3-phosphatase